MSTYLRTNTRVLGAIKVCVSHSSMMLTHWQSPHWHSKKSKNGKKKRDEDFHDFHDDKMIY